MYFWKKIILIEYKVKLRKKLEEENSIGHL